MNIRKIFQIFDATKKQKELILKWAQKTGKDYNKIIEWVESTYKSDAEQFAAANWIIQGYQPKFYNQALYICQQKKLDPLKQNPEELVSSNADMKPKAKPINPDDVLTDKQEDGEGNVTYAARDEDRETIRQIINTHFGVDANPWCLMQAKDGVLTEGAHNMWEHYSAYPKRIAFRNGKLIAFSAGTNPEYREWWDRQDRSFPFIPYNGKKWEGEWESEEGYPVIFEIKHGSVYKYWDADRTARLSNEYSENIEESDVDVEINSKNHTLSIAGGRWYPYTQDAKGNFVIDNPLLKCTVDADMYLQGPYKSFYADGNPGVVCTFKDGKKEGEYVWYHENGQPRRVSTFKNGEEDGVSKAYTEDGVLKESVYYKDGNLDGKYTVYYSNGQPKSITNYKENDEDGLQVSFYEDGTLQSRSSYKDGHVNGKYETFYENGKPDVSGTYVNGKKEGEFTRYTVEGRLLWRANFKNGNYDGPFEQYYSNGNLKEKCNYKDGHRDGERLLYTQDGQLYSKDYFKDGKQYWVSQ